MKPRRLLVRVSHLPSEDGALLAVFVDVTDLRRLESMRRDFVANVSHELRTPVTAVRSAAETLMGGAIGDAATATRFVGMIERNAERLASLIDDLLELSRIESREFRLRRDSTDIAAVVQQVLTTTRDRAERAGVTLIGEVDERTKGFGTDRRALEQVLGNLVDNAVKYCPKSRVVVRAESTDTGGVKLEVADDGPGIESRHLPRIFERFYRVDGGRSRDVGGTGLGLSIVKHLVEALAGKVAVTSTIGTGTTFTITLPNRESSTPTLPLDSTDDLQQSL
jgi:two-component system phosphate regulon sensor histidine kinase PhoR